MSYITVENLVKNYKVLILKKGKFKSIKSIFHREYKIKEAVKGISFNIERGEMVGYIGPNGAGKSTTIKMMSGVLVPSSGKIDVGGIIPYKERKKNARKIGVVFGQRSQLYWDLPISDTFELYRVLYGVPKQIFKKNVEKYIEIFQMSDFINQPVRQLSLGQKMKANIAISLLHDPEILYLDEPTIGLDVMSKKVIRECLIKINKEKNTNIILTTHDMDDIEAVCNRIIIIDKGEKIYDGDIKKFKAEYSNDYVIRMEFDKLVNWSNNDDFKLVSQDNLIWTVKVRKNIGKKEAFIKLINMYNPQNIYIIENDLENIIQSVFESKKVYI